MGVSEDIKGLIEFCLTSVFYFTISKYVCGNKEATGAISVSAIN